MSDIVEQLEAWIRPAGTNVDLPFYREAIDEIKRLRAALADARDALRNDFEPDNQSRAWHRANDALKTRNE